MSYSRLVYESCLPILFFASPPPNELQYAPLDANRMPNRMPGYHTGSLIKDELKFQRTDPWTGPALASGRNPLDLACDGCFAAAASAMASVMAATLQSSEKKQVGRLE